MATLGSQMEGVYLVGSLGFPKSPNRLFAHHIGDGFVVVSDFGGRYSGRARLHCDRAASSCRVDRLVLQGVDR